MAFSVTPECESNIATSKGLTQLVQQPFNAAYGLAKSWRIDASIEEVRASCEPSQELDKYCQDMLFLLDVREVTISRWVFGTGDMVYALLKSNEDLRKKIKEMCNL